MERSTFPTTENLLKAIHFAAKKHRDQRRKNTGQTPYINHPIDVAHLLWFEGQVRDPSTLIAAVLHDTVEDTNTTFEEIESLFGKAVRSIVAEVTDDKHVNWGKRKERQIEKASIVSSPAKLVMLGDKISNLRDVLIDPPESWSQERQAAYFSWANQVINGIRGTNLALETLFDSVQSAFRQKQNHA